MIIVLGGTGFIGMYTIEALLKDGQEVIATGRNKAIGKKIEEMGAILPGAVEEYAYYIEGEELVITKGKPGLSIEKEKLKKQIREAIYKIGIFNKKFIIPIGKLNK